LLPLPTPSSQSWSQFQCLYCLLCCCYRSRLEMPVWNTVVIPTLVLIHITIINCERETNDAKGNVRGVSSLQSISSSKLGNEYSWQMNRPLHVCTNGCVISVTPHQLVVYYQGSWCTYTLTNNSCRRNI
jgi:hypothetical protein